MYNLPFTTNKEELVSSIINVVYELLHELPNDLRLRILENKKILEKSENCMGRRSSSQSSFQSI